MDVFPDELTQRVWLAVCGHLLMRVRFSILGLHTVLEEKSGMLWR